MTNIPKQEYALESMISIKINVEEIIGEVSKKNKLFLLHVNRRSKRHNN